MDESQQQLSISRSLVVPVYDNEGTIPALLEALASLSLHVDDLEVVFVVDGSPDGSGELLAAQAPMQPHATQVIYHSRNFGAFAAIRTGLAHARGGHVAVMAADLQEPPELMLQFFEELATDEIDVIFGVRAARHDPWPTRTVSGLYWNLYRRFVVPDVPPGGVDVFACNERVRHSVLELGESNSSLVAQLFWVGFRRSFVTYTRREREHGSSGWSLRRRFRYMADSIFSFSDLPILVVVWSGIIGVTFSVLVGAATLGARLAGVIQVPGFTTIVLVVTFLFSLLLTTQGIIGMYLWRAFENTKRKPGAIVMRQRVWDGSPVQSDQRRTNNSRPPT